MENNIYEIRPEWFSSCVQQPQTDSIRIVRSSCHHVEPDCEANAFSMTLWHLLEAQLEVTHKNGAAATTRHIDWSCRLQDDWYWLHSNFNPEMHSSISRAYARAIVYTHTHTTHIVVSFCIFCYFFPLPFVSSSDFCRMLIQPILTVAFILWAHFAVRLIVVWRAHTQLEWRRCWCPAIQFFSRSRN